MSFYAIWKQDGKKKPQLMKVNMTVAQATEYITYERQDLPQGERLFTENQETSEVDMIFTTDSVITPDKPLFVSDGRLTSRFVPTKFRTSNSMKQPRMKNSRNSWKGKRRGKWIGNMFRASNSRLRDIQRKGTPKQKKLASEILAKRKK